MDCYDEILKISQESDQRNKFTIYLVEFINKNSRILTELEFKNCVILTLAIWNPESIDSYISKGTEISQLDENKRKMLLELLKSECRDFY